MKHFLIHTDIERQIDRKPARELEGEAEEKEIMYTTKPLTMFNTSLDAAAAAVNQTPGLGSNYLLIRDEESDPNPTSCWGLCEDKRARELPFPQNRILTITYTEHQHGGSGSIGYWRTYKTPALFIPALDKPLSANIYYVVLAKGSDKGKVFTCSKEEDKTTCCFCRCINDVSPKEFDHKDIYQQIEIVQKRGRFTAKSVAPDGFAPWPLRRKYWKLYASKPKEWKLGEAAGLDEVLRRRGPPLELPPRALAAVGRWFAPCAFVKEEGLKIREQFKRSAFYEIALEQSWEEADASPLFVELPQRDAGGGMVWFEALGSAAGGRVGLCGATLERMRWELKRGGRVSSELAKDGRVLVERFVVRRMDGSMAVAIDLKLAPPV